MGKYDDIINLPHHRSSLRPSMPIENRAAQFAPFAALTGHDDAISETARLTHTRIELTEDEKINLSRIIQSALDNNLTLHITYFQKDQKKEGGEYLGIRGEISKIDEINETLILKTGQVINLSDILSISATTP